MGKNTDGRLVWNHSTHIRSLIPVLGRLIYLDGIQTVTPGELGRVKGHSPALQLRVSVPIRGGFKVIAREGKTVQEVFILTQLDQEQLEAAIAIAMKK
ncbi:MAG: metal-binding protein [Stigonema ocellatum SAG 48.90 = DSM 106950]|nr:metal-binding protein [Stigonema ocellatum SAG 48.90 = DSM 106950]